MLNTPSGPTIPDSARYRIHIADEFAIHALKEKMATWKDKFFFVGRRLLGLFITVATFALALFLIGLVVQHGDQITDAFPYGIPLLLAIVKQAPRWDGTGQDSPVDKTGRPIPRLTKLNLCLQGMPPLLNIAVALEGHDSIEQVLLQIVICAMCTFSMLSGPAPECDPCVHLQDVQLVHHVSHKICPSYGRIVCPSYGHVV